MPEAVIGVFTADHLIEPVAEFQRIIGQGFELVEQRPDTLVTFGIEPTGPATGYGYLELGRADRRARPAWSGSSTRSRPWPSPRILPAGAGTLLVEQRHVRVAGGDVVGLHPPLRARRLRGTDPRGAGPGTRRSARRCWPKSIRTEEDQRGFRRDGARLARPGGARGGDSDAARWLDVGSWPSFAETCPRDDAAATPWRPSGTCSRRRPAAWWPPTIRNI